MFRIRIEVKRRQRLNKGRDPNPSWVMGVQWKTLHPQHATLFSTKESAKEWRDGHLFARPGAAEIHDFILERVRPSV